MRQKLFGLLLLATGFWGCDSTPVPPPPGADEAETTLEVDMGGDATGDAGGDTTGEAETSPKKDDP